MSPLVTTFAGASVRALGWTTSGSGKYFMGTINVSGSTPAALNANQDGSCNFLLFNGNFGTINSYGNLVLQKDSALTPFSNGVIADSNGNTYFSGSNVSVQSVSNAGASNWVQNITGSAGNNTGFIDLGSGVPVILKATTSFAAFNVSKWTTGGAITWQRNLTFASATPNGLNVDGSGNIYIQGSNSSTTGVIAKWNSSGALQWQASATLPATPSVLGDGLVTDASGNIYSVHTGGGFFLTKLNTSGAQQWQRQLSKSATNLFASSIATDSAGNVYVAVHTNSTSNGVWIVKYDGTGALQWQRNLITSSPAPAAAMTITDIAVNGTSIYFMGSTGESPSHTYIMRLPTDGSLTGSYVVGSLTFAYTVSAALTDASATSFTYASSSYVEGAGSFTLASGSDTITTTSNTWSTTSLN